MDGLQERRDIQPMPFSPDGPDALGGGNGVQERTVHIEQKGTVTIGEYS
jgi:hypothetical protein